MINIAVVGIGNMGRSHAKAVNDGKINNATLAAVCDANSEQIKWARENLSRTVKIYHDFELLLEDKNVDAIIVATPHYEHPLMGIKALKAGKHILLEKPVGVYTKAVRELNEVALKSNHIFSVMYNQRTNPLYQKVKNIIDTNQLGSIRRTNWIITNWYRSQSYYNSGGWRATWANEGGGVLLNQAPHQLDLWQWICGMPKTVTAFCYFGKHRDIEVENDVTAFVEYSNGATGVFVTSTFDYPGTNRFEIVGDKGQLIIENGKLVFNKNRIPESEFNAQKHDNIFATPGFERIEYEVSENQWSEQHIEVINNFVDAILNGTKLIAPGIEGINGLLLSNAMHLSTFIGKTIDLDNFDEDLFYKELQKRIKFK